MFQNGQKVVVVSSGDPARVIKVQSASGTPDPSRYPIVDTTGVSGRDQSVQIVSGGDPTRFPILRGVSDARSTADSVISALSPAAWYRNATGVTSAGGFASQWDDYSGNTRHLVQGTGTNQPAYAAGVFTFDGADNFMSATSWSQTQPVTIYAVLKQISWTSAERIFDGTTDLTLLLQQASGGASPQVRLFNTSASASSSDLAVGAYGVVCCVFNGATSVLRVNNNADIAANIGTTASGGFSLGSAFAGGIVAANAAFQEVVLFSAAHDDTTRDSVITALNNALTVF